jgi:hypothetical protein
MEKRVLSTLACIAIFTLAMSTTSNAANILVDPGAEQGISTANPPTGYGQGWAFFNGAGFSTAFSLSGTQSLALVTQNNVPGAFQQFAANPGEAWTMTGFGMTPTALNGAPGFGILQITFFSGPNGTGSNLGTVETAPGTAKASAQINNTTTPGVWTPLSVTGHAPATTQSMQAFALVVDFGSSGPEGVYFDDMTLVPEPSTVAMALTGLLGLVAFAKKRRV